MVIVRLARRGTKHRPFYHIVATDNASRRDGRFIEQIGTYDPTAGGGTFKINQEKAETWIKRGAQPTRTVSQLIAKQKKAS